jgi:hypothetical protein
VWRKYDLSLRDPVTWVSRDLMAAYRWVEANTPAAAVVLAPEGAAVGTPRWAYRHAWGGYLSATPDYRTKATVLRAIFDPAGDVAARGAAIAATGARWVIVDPADPVAPGATVAGLPGLTLRFEAGAVAVYEVVAR